MKIVVIYTNVLPNKYAAVFAVVNIVTYSKYSIYSKYI